MLIQNFSGVELEFNPNDKRVPLKYNQLENQKIQALYLIGGHFDLSIYSPYRERYLDDIITTNADYYLNLFDIKGNHIVKDYSFKHLISPFNILDLFKYSINEIIDIEKSYISYSHFEFPLQNNFIFLLCVIYQNQNFLPFSDEINGLSTFILNSNLPYQDIKLDDIVRQKLDGKRIKKILTESYTKTSTISGSGYLDLNCFSGKHIENIPTAFLNKSGQQSIWFDSLDIDFKNSYYRQRGGNPSDPLVTTELTFIY